MPAKKITKKTATKKAPAKKASSDMPEYGASKGCCCKKSCKSMPSTSSCGTIGCIYGLGFIGSAMYYIQTAPGFWSGVWGIIKSFIWPALLVYNLFGFLGM